jgi:hypothetical protein
MSLRGDQTYFVESPNDDTVLLAIDVRLDEGQVEWFDTVRDRAFPVRACRETRDGVFVVTDHTEFRFRPLTLELYNERVIAQVTGHRSFGSTEELQRYYADFPR